MKIFTTCMFSFIFMFSLGQEIQNHEKISTSIGIMVVPQGGIDLKNTKSGFSIQSNVFAVVDFSKERNSLTFFYSVTNYTGLAYSRTFNENYGGYLVINKAVLDKGGYAGIGLSRFVGKSSLFLEFGSSWNQWSPGIYIGAFIPITFKI